ncbi:MAG: hypothetical protein LBH74_09975 [Nitrososphaerota archaeon]|jgi:integrase|nr:hypothetical protein [Nitrososphaerota archaeon]
MTNHPQHPAIQNWISTKKKQNTRTTYTKSLTRFLNSTNLTVDEFLNKTKKETKQLMLQYQTREYDNDVNINTILICIAAANSLLASLDEDKEIKFHNGELFKPSCDTTSHIFETEDLNRLYQYGGATEKAILAVACSLGWEISSVLKLKTEQIKDILAHAKQNNRDYIYRFVTREKEQTPRLMVLNPLAIKCLNQYLDAVPQQERLFPYTCMGIHQMLNRLARHSGLQTTGRLRFHNIRKWLMSRLSSANFNEFQTKFMMGKSIGRADRVYLQTLQREIEAKYPLIYDEFLNITPHPTGTTPQQYTDLKNQLDAYRLTNTDLNNRLTQSEKETADIQKTMNGLAEQVRKLDRIFDRLEGTAETAGS